MKFLYIVLLLFSSQAFSQKATFKEIKLFANPKYFHPGEKYATIVFPLVLTKHKTVSKTINDKIKEEVFSLERKQDIKPELKNQINEGLTDVSYEVTYNRNDILSLSVYVENSGGSHISFYTTYFNFDLRNGKEITLSDLINREKIDSFKNKIFQDRSDSLSKYKQEEFSLIKEKIIDSLDYQWIVERIDEEKTMDDGFAERFILSDQGIEVIESIEFPSAMRSQEPTFHLKYSFPAIQPIMNRGFLNLLIK